MPIPVQRVTTYPSGIHRFLAYDTSNLTIEMLSESQPKETLKIVNDRVYTSNITILGNIEFGSAPGIYKNRLQVNPIRKTIYVNTLTCNVFELETEGIFGGEASNSSVFINQSLLTYYNNNYQDYQLSYQHNINPPKTVYTITLTTPADYGDFVDITVYPQWIQESTSEPGYVFQQVDLSYFRPYGNNIVYMDGNVGIGTSNVISTLTVGGSIFPSACNVYDLGSSNYRFRDIYLSGNTIDLGGTRITRDDSTGGMKILSVTDEPVDIKAKHIYASSNVFASNVIVYGNIQFNNVSLKNNVQVNPIRQTFQVQNDSQSLFTLSTLGIYGGHASNVQIFQGSSLLYYYTSNQTDYTLNILYNQNPPTTNYTITLTTPAVLGQYIDITVWPQLLPESTPQGFVYQNVVLDATSFTTFATQGSSIYYNNGNVGIGTHVPTQKLDVRGNIVCSNISVIGDFVTMNTVTSNTEQVVVENAGTGPALKVTQTGDNSVAEFYDKESGVALFVGNNGNVGIGTNSPLEKLDVNGIVKVNQSFLIQPINNYYTDIRQNIYYNNGWKSLSGGSGSLLVLGGGSSNDSVIRCITFNNSTNTAINDSLTTIEALTIIKNGNVGIGTNNPSQKLEVNGSFKYNNYAFRFGLKDLTILTNGNPIPFNYAESSLPYTTITSYSFQVPVSGIYQFNVILNIDNGLSTSTAYRAGLFVSNNLSITNVSFNDYANASYISNWRLFLIQETVSSQIMNKEGSVITYCNQGEYVRIFFSAQNVSGGNPRNYSWPTYSTLFSGYLISC